MKDVITVNGYNIKSWYEGMTAYEVTKDGEVMYHGWDIGDVYKIVGARFDTYDGEIIEYLEPEKETRYIVRYTATATEINEEYKGDVQVFYAGKDGYVHSSAEYCEPWKSKKSAADFIKRDDEINRSLDESLGVQYWQYAYEIIEVTA